MSGRTDFSKNNLDCLRLVLASVVALFHIFALTELPAYSAFDTYLSPHFAVKAFFVISGLLIYRSYTRSSSAKSYFEKRARRIYPAYFTTIVVAAIGLSLMSSLPLSQYFARAEFWKYLGANLLFLNFLGATLPGVFQTNIDPVVNGALWTLKIEVAFYLFVPVLSYLCDRFGSKKIIAITFGLSCLWRYGFAWLAATHGAGDSDRNIYSQLQVQLPAQLMYFIAGVLLLLYFDKLKMHFASIAMITAVLWGVDHWFAKDMLDVLWISGVVFVFGFWRYFGNFSKHGDFSYGVYILHWPILQVLIDLWLGRIHPAAFLLMSLSAIFLAAVLMWNLVESRFLAGSSHYRQAAVKTMP